MGNFPILETLMLEIYITNPPEICVRVVPHALVCANFFWADGVALRASKVGKPGKILQKSKDIVVEGGADAPLEVEVWEIFHFFTH